MGRFDATQFGPGQFLQSERIAGGLGVGGAGAIACQRGVNSYE